MDVSTLQDCLKPLEAADQTADKLNEILLISTPSNISMIVYEARQLKIDTAESLSQCVDVLYENAVNSSPSIIANICTKLMFASVPLCKESQRMKTFKEQIYDKARNEVENFIEIQGLLNVGQKLYKSESWENEPDEVIKSSCMRRLRRPMGLFKFLGELYLVDLLTSSFIDDCIVKLLDSQSCNESTLEILHGLLKIVGRKLEITEKVNLSDHFETIKERKSSTVINPHTRFMIEELFDMRKNHWETIEEINWINFYNMFLCDVDEKLYILELWYGK